MKYYLDIGASDGADSLELAKDSNNYIIAFEPIPKMYWGLYHKTLVLKNYTVFNLAIDSVEEVKLFKIGHQVLGQCSSLLDYVDDFKEWSADKQKWFTVDEQVEVTTIRMDTFLNRFFPGVNEIEFMHCDTQGKDLDVLESFGDKIRMIKAGKVETVISAEKALYKGQRNLLPDVEKFLVERGFKIVEYLGWENERDVVFERI